MKKLFMTVVVAVLLFGFSIQTYAELVENSAFNFDDFCKNEWERLPKGFSLRCLDNGNGLNRVRTYLEYTRDELATILQIKNDTLCVFGLGRKPGVNLVYLAKGWFAKKVILECIYWAELRRRGEEDIILAQQDFPEVVRKDREYFEIKIRDIQFLEDFKLFLDGIILEVCDRLQHFLRQKETELKERNMRIKSGGPLGCL